MESVPQYTREKAESELYSTYEKSVQTLEAGDLAAGSSLLASLLSNPLLASLNDPDLKYSIFFSLAHAREAQGNIDHALSLYYQAGKLKGHSDPNLWLRIALLCERQGYFNQADFCYQETLKTSKAVAFDRVLYEKMVRMSFLSYEWENTLKRLDFLSRSGPLPEEMLTIRLFIYQRKGPEELSNSTRQEIIARNPGFTIENIEVIARLLKSERLENEQRKKEDILRKTEEKDRDFVISLDKLNWKHCLEFLIFALKVLLLKARGLPLKAKQRKSKFKAHIDQILAVSLAETSVAFKEREGPAKKKSKSPANPASLDPAEGIWKREDKSEEKAAMEIEETAVGLYEALLENQLRGKSKRIQSIKNSELSLDEHLQSICLKKNQRLAAMLADFKAKALETLPRETLDLFHSLFKAFLPKEPSAEVIIIEESLLNRKVPGPKSGTLDVKITEEKTLKKLSNFDFLRFLSTHRAQRYPTFLALADAIVLHFITNGVHPSPSNPESQYFGPNPLLSSPEIRRLLMKLYLQLWSFTFPSFEDLGSNLTLFELVFDSYLERKARARPQNPEKTARKLLILRSVLSEISERFLFSNFSTDFSAEQSLLLRLRTYHILTVYYTYKDFAAVHMAKSTLKLLRKSLNELLGKDPTGISENSDFLNLFWLNCKGINSGFFELIEERLQDSRRPLISMDLDVRKRKLINYIELFNERVSMSFEDAMDLYYPHILEFTLKPGLDPETLLTAVREILTILHKVCGGRKSGLEDMRKTLFKTIEALKLEAVLQGFIEFSRNQSLPCEVSRLMDVGLLILKHLTSVIGLLQQDPPSKEIPPCFQDLCLAFTQILSVFSNTENPELVVVSFDFLHLLIDSVNESSQTLHRSLFPLPLRTYYIRRLFTEYEKSSPSSHEELYGKISQYFTCFYGVFSHRKQETSSDLLSEERSQGVITSMSEISFFVKFIAVFEDGYFGLNPPRFKSSLQTLLTASFDFLKHHDDQWILCPRLESLVNENLNKYLENGDFSLIKEMFGLRMKNQGSNCFCSESCFPKEDENVCMYEKGFFLMGKAFYEQDLENVQQRKSRIKRAEKMFQLNVCLNPREPMSWLFLARVYREMSFLYADQAIYAKISFKIEEFEAASRKVERILNDLLKRIDNRGSLSSNPMVIEGEGESQSLQAIRCEARDTLVILAIIELMQGKLKWVKGEIRWFEYLSLQQSGVAKIEAVSVDEDCVRGFLLRELFVRRKNLAIFGALSNIQHLQNLTRAKDKVQKMLIKDTEDFKDESLLNEIETEACISLWKIAKRYVKLLKFLDVLGFERVKSRLDPTLLSRLRIHTISDLHILIQRDCFSFLFGLKTLIDLNEFHELQNEISASGEKDECLVGATLNTGELIKAGSEMEVEKMLLMITGVLMGCETLDCPLEYQKLPLNRWINRFFEVLLGKLARLINRSQKKYRYFKHYVLLSYYSAKIFVFLHRHEDPRSDMTQGKIAGLLALGGPSSLGSDKFLKNFDELFSIKTYELVEIYKKEKDPTLCSLFHRDLLFLFLKLKLLKLRSRLSLDRQADIDKLRILNNKISRVMISKGLDGQSEIINEVLILAYSLTLRDLMALLKRYFNGEKPPNEAPLLKWIDDLISTVIRQKTVNGFLKERQPELVRDFEDFLRMGYCYFGRREEKSGFEEIKDDEEGLKTALQYFFSHHARKKKPKKTEENKPIPAEINIID